jgi:hypothetical protein
MEPRQFRNCALLLARNSPLWQRGVRTENKGNKRTEDIGNSFHGGGSDWAEKVLEGDTQSPTRSRSFVISEM